MRPCPRPHELSHHSRLRRHRSGGSCDSVLNKSPALLLAFITNHSQRFLKRRKRERIEPASVPTSMAVSACSTASLIPSTNIPEPGTRDRMNLAKSIVSSFAPKADLSVAASISALIMLFTSERVRV